MNALHVVLVSTSVRLKQSAKAISTKLILTFVLIVAHVPKFARLKQSALNNKFVGSYRNYSPVLLNPGFFMPGRCNFLVSFLSFKNGNK